MVGAVQTVDKASQSFRPQAKIKSNLFFPGACITEKTLLSPQVCAPMGRARSGLHPLSHGKPAQRFPGEALFSNFPAERLDFTENIKYNR